MGITSTASHLQPARKQISYSSFIKMNRPSSKRWHRLMKLNYSHIMTYSRKEAGIETDKKSIKIPRRSKLVVLSSTGHIVVLSSTGHIRVDTVMGGAKNRRFPSVEWKYDSLIFLHTHACGNCYRVIHKTVLFTRPLTEAKIPLPTKPLRSVSYYSSFVRFFLLLLLGVHQTPNYYFSSFSPYLNDERDGDPR